MSSGQKILLAMSGGVDSSVAAALLAKEGHEVVGVFMRLGSPGEPLEQLIPGEECTLRIGKQGCCSVGDADDARQVAGALEIPFYVVNFKREFSRIIDYFVAEYDAGRTPNPCVRCNDWLKFGRLHEYAKQIGAARVASGHYAAIEDGPDGPRLLRGLDEGKDQSYVLFGTPRERLHEMLLPIGDMHKRDVRAMAKELGLPVFDKPDSQEICFVPDNDYAGLVSRQSATGIKPGPLLDLEGNQIGEHPGHQHFTIGQRRKVGVSLGHPIFVVNKDAESNTVVVGPREALKSAGCRAAESNWFIEPPQDWLPCTARIRYNSEPVPAEVRVTGNDTIEVRFQEPQDAVAPGQAVVCYCERVVLGGGWIEESVSESSDFAGQPT
jgi:tRNA-specific 2-thiouridylase